MNDYQRRGMQYEWVKKQEEEKRKREKKDADEDEPSVQGGSGWQGAGYFELEDRFSRVEEQVESLKQELSSGRITEIQFNEQLNNLMLQDVSGNWWMVGTSSGGWYRFDGQNWVQSTPPGRWVGNNEETIRKSISTKPARHKNRFFNAVIQFIMYSLINLVVGYGIGLLFFEVLGFNNEDQFLIVALIVWGIGLILTIILVGRTWRRNK